MIVKVFRCDQCGTESEDGTNWLLIDCVRVYRLSAVGEEGEIIINEPAGSGADRLLTVCGQECFFRFLAARFAQHFDPRGRVEIGACAVANE
jgi:hypothetical protein